MTERFLALRFIDDGDGTGNLLVQISADGFAGHGGAYFDRGVLERFASAIASFPVTTRPRPELAGGFFEQGGTGALTQEHLAIAVYPVDSRGHVGIQVRLQ